MCPIPYLFSDSAWWQLLGEGASEASWGALAVGPVCSSVTKLEVISESSWFLSLDGLFLLEFVHLQILSFM